MVDLFPKPKVVQDIEQIRKEDQRSSGGVSGRVGKQSPGHTPVVSGPVSQKPVVEEKPSEYTPVKEDIASKLSSVRQQQMQVFFMPPSARLYDASGRSYSKQEAMGVLGQQRQQLKEQKAQIEAYEEFGYHVRSGDQPGVFEFYRTPEEQREQVVQQKMKQLDVVYREDKLAGVGHVVSTGLLSWEDPFGIRSAGAYLVGGQPAFLRVKAEASLGLDQAIERGALDYFFVAGTGPLATVGSAFTLGAGLNVVETGLSGAAATARLAGEAGLRAGIVRTAPTVFRLAATGTGVVIAGMMAKDVVETSQRDPLLGFAKGVTYGAAWAAALKGYELAGGKAGVRAKVEAAESRFYESHPERIRLFSGERGVKGGSFEQEGQPKLDVFQSKGTPKEVSRFRVKSVQEWVPGGEEMVSTQKPGGKVMRIRSVHGTKASGVELQGDVSGVKSKVLLEDLGLSDVTMRSGEIKVGGGRKIVDVKMGEIRHTKDLSLRELGGSGGFTVQEQVPLVDSGLVSDIAPLFSISGGVSGRLIPPVVVPVVGLVSKYGVGEVRVPGFELGEVREFSRVPVSGRLSVSERVVGFGDVAGFTSGKVSGFDDMQMQVFDIGQITADMGVPGMSVSSVPVFEGGKPVGGGLPLPGLSLRGDLGGDDLRWLNVFGRTRRYRTGSLGKAFEVGRL